MADLMSLQALAARQHHLLTRAQALSCGLSTGAWYRWVESGRLIQVHPGVAALPGAALDRTTLAHAATLAVGPGALTSHATSLLLWGVDVDVPGTDLIVPEACRPQLDGVRLHRPRDRADLRPIRRDGIPTANVLRALLDLGQVAAPSVVADALARTVIAGLVSRAAVAGCLARHADRGRTGVGALRAALDEWTLGDKPPDSVLETAFARLVMTHGLPAPTFHLIVGRHEVDFAFPASKVIVEVDGWDVHGTRRSFEADRARDAELAAQGWLVLRFTWLQVKRQPSRVAARLAEVLAIRSAA